MIRRVITLVDTKKVVEEGRIRIGETVKTRSGGTAPTMRDTFLLTSSNRSILEFAATVFGGTVERWPDRIAAMGGEVKKHHKGQFVLATDRTQIKVLVSTQFGLSQSYELWAGGGCKRRCDGETVETVDGEPSGAPCMCDPDKRASGDKNSCALITRFAVMLPEVPSIALWRLDSKGSMFGTEILTTIETLDAMGFSRGPVCCTLTIDQREIKRPGQPARKFAVPVLSIDPAPVSLSALVQGIQRSALAPPSDAPALPSAPAASALPQGDAKKEAGTWMGKLGMNGAARKEFADAVGDNWVAVVLDAKASGRVTTAAELLGFHKEREATQEPDEPVFSEVEGAGGEPIEAVFSEQDPTSEGASNDAAEIEATKYWHSLQPSASEQDWRDAYAKRCGELNESWAKGMLEARGAGCGSPDEVRAYLEAGTLPGGIQETLL